MSLARIVIRVRKGLVNRTRKSSWSVVILAAGLLIDVSSRPQHLLAAETAEITAMPASQTNTSDYQPPSASSRVTSYQVRQNTLRVEPPGLQEYMEAADEISLFGIDLRRDQRGTDKNIQGLMVEDVAAGSPGAAAGLRPHRHVVRDVVRGVGVFAVMAFPPAVMALPIVDVVPAGENYDMIIGVDGSRVTNFAELYYSVRDVQPGEIIYLNILRDGHRVQLPLRVTTSLPPPEAWVQ